MPNEQMTELRELLNDRVNAWASIANSLYFGHPQYMTAQIRSWTYSKAIILLDQVVKKHQEKSS